MAEARAAVKTIDEINARLRRGEAIVLTAHEIKDAYRRGERFSANDVDVVTTGTRGPMSGTAAAFSLPIEGWRGSRAPAKAWINGVPAFVGPAHGRPGETLDVIVYGTAGSRHAPRRYGGGHLFRELVEGRPVALELRGEDGHALERTARLGDFGFASLFNTRNAFRNYMAFANFRSDEPIGTIFGFRPAGLHTGITVVGSGETNPIQNDPGLEVIRVGTRVLVNGAPGIVVGHGTNSTPARPNLSVVADMFAMRAEYLGGFITDAAMEVINAIAIPIPVLDDGVLERVLEARDENVPLPVADVSDRTPFVQSTYAQVWQGTDLAIRYDPARCVTCSFACVAEHYCPVGAISWRDRRHDDSRCVACGACTVNCVGGAFSANLGSIRVEGATRPITFRQSDRRRAMRIAELLKEMMLRGEFLLGELGERIEHRHG